MRARWQHVGVSGIERACACGVRRGRVILRAQRYCRYGDAFADLDYRLVRCAGCGLVRTEPTPDEGAHELFEDPAFIETYLEREPLFERFLAPVVDEVRRVIGPPARLLDVGANVGTLVRLAAEAGYEATGLELNEAAVAFAQGRGIDVRAALLEDAGFADGSIDAITMSAVAEHLHDLDTTFATCHRLLRAGGVLVAANSPNIRSLAWLLERAAWYGLQPQGHPWQFTPGTLGDVLERCGFRLIERRTFGMHRDFGRNRKQRLKRLALRTAEQVGFGDALTLVALRS